MQQVESIDRDIAVVGDHGWEASMSGWPFCMLLACKMAARIRYGALKFILPDGRVLRFSGAEEIESEGVIIVKRWAFARRSVLGDDIGEGFVTNDSGTPALSGALGLSWEPLRAAAIDGWLDLSLRGETGSHREEPSSSGASTLREDDSWLTLKLGGGAQFGSERRLGIVVELANLSDESYSTSAENVYAPGRSVSARLTLALD